MNNPVTNMRWAKFPTGDVTQWFGENPELYKSVMGLAGHNGIDIVRPHGEHLFAVEDGTVCAVKEDAGGHGRHIRLVSDTKDELGYYRDWVYGHMDTIAVKNGQKVKAGQFVGTMGNTGFVVSGNTPFWGTNPYAGTHLHLGLRYLQKDPNGWRYEGLDTRWKAVNYSNGYKGRVNPLPLFLNQTLKSTKVLHLASLYQNTVLYQFGDLLKKLGY